MATSNSAVLRVYTVRFLPDQELKASLEDFVLDNSLHAAFVMTCVGSVRKATLRFATQPPGPRTEKVVTYEENMEICSLSGTLSQEGTHLHVVLGRADGTVVAGHVVGDMVVQTTAEVVLGNSLAEHYSRIYDPRTSYKELLVFKKK